MSVTPTNDPSPQDESQGDLGKTRLRQIPIHEIDIAEKLGNETELLVEGLKRLGLYQDRYGFSVIHSSLLSTVLESGTYRFFRDGREKSTVFCLRAERSVSGEESLCDTWYDWSNYVLVEPKDSCRDVPIVIYDLDKLSPVPGSGNVQYRFNSERKIDAVVAVVVLKNY